MPFILADARQLSQNKLTNYVIDEFRKSALMDKLAWDNNAKSQLSDKGLPVELAEVLPYTDADTTNAALAAVEKVFRQAVEKGVTERLKGNAPKVSQGGTAKISAEDAEKMSYAERVRLFQTDKESYDKYFGGK